MNGVNSFGVLKLNSTPIKVASRRKPIASDARMGDTAFMTSVMTVRRWSVVDPARCCRTQFKMAWLRASKSPSLLRFR